MDRRTFLGAVAAGGVVGTGGCLGVLQGDQNPNVVLGPPDLDVTIEQHRGRRYPVWGERVPDVSLPAIPGDSVAVRDLDEPALITFFFSHCRTVCPRLVSGLVNVQGHAVENDYADAVRFLPVTFDPARDDADHLRSYGDRLNVRSVGDWQWLRPASEARARRVVADQFGIRYVRQQREHESGYLFVHPGVVMLVNPDGYVERAYRVGTETPPPVETMIDDLRQVRTA